VSAVGREERWRILLPEGSSLSAREAITALGLAGHHLEICDPDRRCIGRFSRFVRRFHRCPPMGSEPVAFLDFTLELLARRRFDVLLPTHEQAYLFAAARHRLPSAVGTALASFASFERVQGKAAFSALLDELRLPQPRTAIIRSVQALVDCDIAPAFIKTTIGTASHGIWRAANASERARVAADLAAAGAFADAVLVQAAARGALERAQAIFAEGRLLAMHAYRQVAAAAGGGDAIKVSVHRPMVRTHMVELGAALAWHGALSVDYILDERGTPLYIDANPRLVEPMNARLAGNDLAGLLAAVSLGHAAAPATESRAGARTHLTVQALVGAALEGATRRQLIAECWRLWRRSGRYAGSTEELTPFWADPASAVPVAIVLLALLRDPRGARRLAGDFARRHQLTPDAVATIRAVVADAAPAAAG
jgi:predicted ATP-grasp superfamily ATP-dependent carboligase